MLWAIFVLFTAAVAPFIADRIQQCMQIGAWLFSMGHVPMKVNPIGLFELHLNELPMPFTKERVSIL